MRSVALIVLTSVILATSPALAAEGKDDICAALDSIPIAKLREEFKHYDNPDEKMKQLLEGPAREEGCRVTYWQAFKAKSARDVLGPEGFGAYERALDQSDCDTAFALLVNAFPAAHPRAPNILDNDRHREQWVVSTVGAQYTEVHFCRLLREIQEAQAEIEKGGIVAGRYHSGDEYARVGDQPRPVWMRNTALALLIHLDHYAPALMAVVKLSHEGKVVRFVPEYQYFLLQRALLKGIDRNRLADMLAVTTEKLTPSQMESLKRQARAGVYAVSEPITE